MSNAFDEVEIAVISLQEYVQAVLLIPFQRSFEGITEQDHLMLWIDIDKIYISPVRKCSLNTAC